MNIPLKRLLILTFSTCLLGSTIVRADNQHTRESGTQCLKNDDVKTLRQAFMSGAEVYYGKLLDGQEQQFVHIMNTIDTYIDFFASQNYKDVPEWELPALAHAREGEMEQAWAIYQDHDLLNGYKASKVSYETIERFVMLSQLTGVRSNARAGLELLERVANWDSTLIDGLSLLVTVAMDLHLQGLADEYIQLYQRRAGNNELRQAKLLRTKGLVAYRRNRPNEALTHAVACENLYRKLIEESHNPQLERISRAKNFLGLSRIYHRLGQDENCVRSIRSCRACLALDEEDNSHLLYRIQTLNHLAPLAADHNAFFLADSIYQEVDELGSWFFEGNAYRQSEFFFNSKRLRGLVAYRVGKWDEARMYFDQAMEILNRMEQMSPGQNQEDYENIYFNIASLHYAEGDIEKALEMNRKMLEMVENCTVHDEIRKKKDIAFCHKYIGNCLWALAYKKYLEAKKRKVKEVMQYYQEANDQYNLALQYAPKDAEALSKLNLAQLILSGMEKPMAMPENF